MSDFCLPTSFIRPRSGNRINARRGGRPIDLDPGETWTRSDRFRRPSDVFLLFIFAVTPQKLTDQRDLRTVLSMSHKVPKLCAISRFNFIDL